VARKRMIDQDIWDSAQVRCLSLSAFKIYIFLISQADDKGRIKVREESMALRLGLHRRTVQTSLAQIVECGLCLAYMVNGEQYLVHPNWQRYQYLSHPAPSKYPEPPDTPEFSGVLRNTPASRVEKSREEGDAAAAKSERRRPTEERFAGDEARTSEFASLLAERKRVR
jgi:hypothetical protein